MKFKSILKFSLTNLKRRKLRTFLTTLGVSVAVGTLFFLLNTAESIKGQITDLTLKFSDATRIQVHEKSNFSLLPSKETATSSAERKTVTDRSIAEFKAISHVRASYPQIYPQSGLVEYTLANVKEATSSSVFLNAYFTEDSEQIKILYGSEGIMKEGTFFQNNDNDAVIPQEALATKLDLKTGDTVNIEVVQAIAEANGQPKRKKLGSFEAKVVGIAKNPPPDPFIPVSPDNNTAYISFSLNKKIYNITPTDPNVPAEFSLKNGEYFEAVVFVDSINNVREVEKKIEEMGYDAFSVFSQIDAVNTFFLVIQGILAGFSLIGLIIALIGISNTMFMSVLERTREIGILKALGAADRDISRIFVVESAFFGFFGALLGIFVSSLLGFVLAFIGDFFARNQLQGLTSGAPPAIADDLHVRYSIDPQIALATIIFAVILSIIAGFLPAKRASRLDPIQSLKYE